MVRAFTLIEAIFVIVVLSIITMIGVRITTELYKRNYIAKEVSNFAFLTQQTEDILSERLYNRIPLTVIGYNPSTHDFKYIGEIESDDNYTVFEWISDSFDAKKDLNLSGFIDMAKSKKPILYAKDFHKNFIEEVEQNKFNTSKKLEDITAIIFAGSFDRGEEAALDDYNNSFGWHKNKHKYVFRIDEINQSGDDANISLKDDTDRIYEKFYLVDSAYAIALKRDLNKSAWKCDVPWEKFKDNDMLLFYNYRPWDGDTFCADNNGTPEGNVTLLLNNVNGFKIRSVNSHLEILINMKSRKGDINISVSKQKVAF